MSKSLQSFEGKVRSLKQHAQLTDVALSTICKTCLQNSGNGKTIGKTLFTTTKKHPQLNIPNEKLDISRTFTTSRIKINEQTLIELYAYFADYLSSVIREIEGINPHRILNLIPPQSPVNMSYKDIFTYGTYSTLLDEIAKRVFRALESERSTPKLLKKFIKTAKLNIPTNIQQNALTYLEIRHLIIHNNSKADTAFYALNNSGLVKVNPQNKKVNINYALASSAIDAVSQLCRALDNELIRVGLI